MTSFNNFFLIDDDQTYTFIHAQTSQETFKDSKRDRKVKAFHSAQSALSELEHLLNANPEEIPEIIFLDINMPFMNGWDFLDEFSKFPSEKFKHCKVFILTSSFDKKNVDKSIIYIMVQDFITQPLTEEKLKGIFADTNSEMEAVA